MERRNVLLVVETIQQCTMPIVTLGDVGHQFLFVC